MILVALAHWILIGFGIFLIGVGLLMLFSPQRMRDYIRRAGSTNLINYTEITVRMIPAAALVVYAAYSRFPEAFRIVGWFMIATSLVLYFVPRRLHHQYALWCADWLEPVYMRLMSPVSVAMGGLVIYAAST